MINKDNGCVVKVEGLGEVLFAVDVCHCLSLACSWNLKSCWNLSNCLNTAPKTSPAELPCPLYMIFLIVVPAPFDLQTSSISRYRLAVPVDFRPRSHRVVVLPITTTHSCKPQTSNNISFDLQSNALYNRHLNFCIAPRRLLVLLLPAKRPPLP